MAVTGLGFPLFSLSDDSDVAAKLNAISNAVNAYLVAQNGAIQHNSGLSISAGTGWGSIDYYWSIRFGMVYLRLQATRTGATITAPSTGNIANSTIATLNTTAYQPSATQIGRAYCSATGGSAYFSTAGNWVVTDLNPTSTISTADTIIANFVYPV